jgi:hypothetical protein
MQSPKHLHVFSPQDLVHLRRNVSQGHNEGLESDPQWGVKQLFPDTKRGQVFLLV